MFPILDLTAIQAATPTVAKENKKQVSVLVYMFEQAHYGYLVPIRNILT